MEQRRAQRNGQYPTIREYYHEMGRSRRLSPRVQMGLKLYGSGNAMTLKEAAETVGLTPVHLGNVKNWGGGQAVVDGIQQDIHSAAVNTSALIERLGQEAIARIADSMRHATSEALKLKAAIDLADRSPATSKTQKLDVGGFSLSPESAKGLAEALVTAKRTEDFKHLVQGDFIRVDEVQVVQPLVEEVK